MLCISHVTQKRNKKLEIEEENALDNNAQLAPSEYLLHSIMGYSGSGWGACFISQPNIELNITGTGHAIRGASHFVMRADYLPPKKSAFRRAKDKLVEKLYEANLKPVPQTVSFD